MYYFFLLCSLFPFFLSGIELPHFDAPVWKKEARSYDFEKIERAVCKIETQPVSSKLRTYRYSSISGLFYKLPKTSKVLYCPGFSGKDMIGRGVYKRVYKGFLYTGSQVEKVAVGVGKNECILLEARIMQKIKFPDELQTFRAFFKKKHKMILVTKYYNLGSLRQQYAKRVHFSTADKAKIALDALSSLKSIHISHMAHRDLHDGNILVHRSSDGTIKAAIVDFGRTMYTWKKRNKRPEGSRFRNPPETIYQSFKSIDTPRADLYAFGCFLYKLFIGKEYKPSFLYDCSKAPFHSKSKKRHLYSKVVRAYAHEQFRFQAILDNSRSQKRLVNQLKKDILKLLEPNPKKRNGLNVLEEDLRKLL